jgi:hypothetical protein
VKQTSAFRTVARWAVGLGLVGFVGMAQTAWAESSLVTRTDAVRVFEMPHLKAKTLETLAQGSSVAGLEKKGLFWKVKTPKGTTGFVMVTKVGVPGDEGSKLQGAMRSLLIQRQAADGSGESARLRSKNAVMGIRGLDSDDLSRVGHLRPNYGALSQLESLEVDPRVVDQLAQDVLNEASARSGL